MLCRQCFGDLPVGIGEGLVCVELGLEPVFDVAVVNVTVVVGQTAVLPCSIEYLGNFKVGKSSAV